MTAARILAARILLGMLAVSLAAASGAARATQVVTVDAMDNIYGAGLNQPPGGGNVPAVVTVPASASCFVIKDITGSLPCGSAKGCITMNHNLSFLNDPDGAHAQVLGSGNDGTALISGLKAPGAGYLVGLFVQGRKPSGPAPAPLDFTAPGGTGFATLSPLLDQTFFVGDGRTRDHVGPLQTFLVPPGATKLYFGISDACGGFQGAPGCYFDNAGTYQFALGFRRSCSAP